jgi:hypothetical protein
MYAVFFIAIIWKNLEDLKDSSLSISWLRLDPKKGPLCAESLPSTDVQISMI